MANGPFLIVLRADDPERFRIFARRNPAHKVKITWDRNDYNGLRWIIRPSDNFEGYSLSFTLPEVLDEFIFRSNNPIRNALDVKEEFFSNITIYSFVNRQDEIYRLEYSFR